MRNPMTALRPDSPPAVRADRRVGGAPRAFQVTLLALFSLGFGCRYRNQPIDGTQQCGPAGGQRCPDGYACAADNRCYRAGAGPTTDAGGDDMNPVDMTISPDGTDAPRADLTGVDVNGMDLAGTDTGPDVTGTDTGAGGTGGDAGPSCPPYATGPCGCSSTRAEHSARAEHAKRGPVADTKPEARRAGGHRRATRSARSR